MQRGGVGEGECTVSFLGEYSEGSKGTSDVKQGLPLPFPKY